MVTRASSSIENDGATESDLARLYFMCDCGNRVRCFFRDTSNGTAWVIDMIHYPYQGVENHTNAEVLSVVWTNEATTANVSDITISQIYGVMNGSKCGSRTNINNDLYGGVETWRKP